MKNRTTQTIAISSLATLLLGAPAFAQQNMEYFSHNTPGHKPSTAPLQAGVSAAGTNATPTYSTKDTVPVTVKHNPVGAGPLAMMSEDSPAKEWFEKFDDMVYSLRVTEADKVTLKRPFNQEAERVQDWTQCAKKVAKNFRLLSMNIKSMPIPKDYPAFKGLRDMTADWYADKASVYEDLIKPRPPATTKEELDEALGEIASRSNSLGEVRKELSTMDKQLRIAYRVHLDTHTDALQQYVKNPNLK